MSKDNFNIRKASILDWLKIYILMKGFFKEFSHNELAKIIYLATHKHNIFVAEKSGYIAGLIIFNQYDNKSWLDFLIVAPEYRRYGIAAALLHSLEGQCKDSGYDELNIAVLRNNNVALKFYKKHGFFQIGDDLNKLLLKKTISTTLEKNATKHQKRNNIFRKVANRLIFIFYKVIFLYVYISARVFSKRTKDPLYMKSK